MSNEEDMSDNALWVAVNGLILAFLLALVVGVTWIVRRYGERMAELGYQEEILPGSTVSHWRCHVVSHWRCHVGGSADE